MPDLLGPWGGMPELLWAQGGVCRNFCGFTRGGMPENLGAQGEVCPNFCGLRGGYARTIVGLGGGMPEILRA